jgi:CheY-like chemotaxis protein
MPDEPQDGSGDDLIQMLSRRVVGQPAAMQYLVPYIQMYQAGLNPPDRPAGIFLLLGPTGTGKTRTVEALAEVLHGDAKRLVKIDCGEYQSDHEVAKLIGAPPGYLGHRETKPMLTTERLLAATSPASDLALVLFDEIEKAAPALTTLLLGVLDKATVRLGDNTQVSFERTFIFLTSNLGAREMMKEVQPDIGFQTVGPRGGADLSSRLESIGLAAVRKRFSPEFVNRIDVVITYQPLDESSIGAIVDHHIADLQRHVHTRLADRSFEIVVTAEARQLLAAKGTNPQYGARELKRTIHRMLTQPLAGLVADRAIAPGSRVIVDRDPEAESLRIQPIAPAIAPEAPSERPVVLVLDDNRHLLEWLRETLEARGMNPVTAESAKEAREVATATQPEAALIDVMLPDDDGLTVALHLVRQYPRLQVIVMTGMNLTADELLLTSRYDFPVLRKPFLAADVVGLLHARLGQRGDRSAAAGMQM